MKTMLILISLLLGSSVYASEKVFFTEPKDQATVGQNFHVKMGVEGRKICNAGQETPDKTCGHHHIIVDGAAMAAGQVLPADATHLHYGKGQTEADLNLKPGTHKLTLQFADFAHRSYGEALSQTITVNVK